MGRIKLTINNRELAALLLYVLGIEENRTEIYYIASDKSRKDVESLSQIRNAVSRWWASGRVQQGLEHARAIVYERDARNSMKAKEDERNRLFAEAQENGNGGSERTDGGKKKAFSIYVDYTNPDNQRRKLNELVNTASDSGEALDALKVIMSGQKADREAAREQKQVRTYLPLTCDACPLYAKAREKSGKG